MDSAVPVPPDIASEELGKAFGLAEIVFQTSLQTGQLHGEDTKFVSALLSDHHKIKQRWFVNSFFDIFGPNKGRGQFRAMWKRYLTIQRAKNNAIYAGLTRGNHHIVRPFLISASKSKRQIRMVNDALLDSVEGTLNGKYCYEEVADQVFRNRRLLKKLLSAARTVR